MDTGLYLPLKNKPSTSLLDFVHLLNEVRVRNSVQQPRGKTSLDLSITSNVNKAQATLN